MAKKVEEIRVNFKELDYIREMIRSIVTKIQGTGRGAWDHSGFYIGRGVTNFKFYDVNANTYQMNQIVRAVANEFKDYVVFKVHRNLYVYLRGNPRG